MINEKDVWESGYMNSEEEDYVLVRQEDIVDGIACFMAAYLLSLKQTKVCEIISYVSLIFLGHVPHLCCWFISTVKDLDTD